MRFQTTRTVSHFSAAYLCHSGLFCAMFSQAPVLLFSRSSIQWDYWIWVCLCYTQPRDKRGPIWHFLASAAVSADQNLIINKTKADELEFLVRPCLGQRGGTHPGNVAMSAAVNIHAHRCSLGSSLDLCLDCVRTKAQTNPGTQTEDAKPTPVKALCSLHPSSCRGPVMSLQRYWEKISIFPVFTNSG